MNFPEEFFMPYIISNIAAIIILISAIYWHKIARLLFVLLFGWASVTNATTAIKSPEVYLEYAEYTFLEFYRSFINGFFAEHLSVFILIIAIGQLIIAIGMLLKGIWVKLAAAGAIIFLLCIAPLGAAAAFPFSLTVSLAAFLIFRYKNQEYLWKFNRKEGGHGKVKYA